MAAWGWGWKEGGDVRATRGLRQVGGDLHSFVMMLWEVYIRTSQSAYFQYTSSYHNPFGEKIKKLDFKGAQKTKICIFFF